IGDAAAHVGEGRPMTEAVAAFLQQCRDRAVLRGVVLAGNACRIAVEPGTLRVGHVTPRNRGVAGRRGLRRGTGCSLWLVPVSPPEILWLRCAEGCGGVRAAALCLSRVRCSTAFALDCSTRPERAASRIAAQEWETKMRTIMLAFVFLVLAACAREPDAEAVR